MGRVVHFEIHADDPERASRFYAELFGWQITRWDGPVEYRILVTGPDGTPGINGGLVRRQGPAGGPGAMNGYVCTVDVDDLDRHVERAQTLGGSVALPKMPIPGVGWLAYLTDTAGNAFGMMQPDGAAS